MRVILAKDAVLVREGMARVLAEAGFEVIGQAGDAVELVDLVDRDPPDAAIIEIRQTHPNVGLSCSPNTSTPTTRCA